MRELLRFSGLSSSRGDGGRHVKRRWASVLGESGPVQGAAAGAPDGTESAHYNHHHNHHAAGVSQPASAQTAAAGTAVGAAASDAMAPLPMTPPTPPQTLGGRAAGSSGGLPARRGGVKKAAGSGATSKVRPPGLRPEPGCTIVCTDPIPSFCVDLDAPAAERWASVIDAYRDRIQDVVAEVEHHILGDWFQQHARWGKLVKGLLLRLVRTFASWMENYEELRGLSSGLGVPLEKLCLLQLAYEAFSSCTAVVTDSPDGPVLARNLDWGLPLLRDFLINVTFMRHGRPLYCATTFVGYVGVLTGMKPGAFSVCVNFRCASPNSPAGANLAAAALYMLTGAWPVSLLVRRVLEQDADFATAVHSCTNSVLISPTYITLAGIREGQGVVISRDRQGLAPAGIWRLSDGAVVQANMDHTDTDPVMDEAMGESLLRREIGRQILHRMPTAAVSPTTLARLLETYPVGNETTVHWTIAIAVTGMYHVGWSRWFQNPPESGLCTFCGPATDPAADPCRRHQRVCNAKAYRPRAAKAAGFASYYCRKHSPVDFSNLLYLACAAPGDSKASPCRPPGAVPPLHAPSVAAVSVPSASEAKRRRTTVA